MIACDYKVKESDDNLDDNNDKSCYYDFDEKKRIDCGRVLNPNDKVII